MQSGFSKSLGVFSMQSKLIYRKRVSSTITLPGAVGDQRKQSYSSCCQAE